MFALHASSRPPPSRLRALQLPLLHQQSCRWRPDSFHRIRYPLLLAHRVCGYPTLQLSPPNPCLPHPSLLGSFRRRAQEVHQTTQEVVQSHFLSEKEGVIKTQVWQSPRFRQVRNSRRSEPRTHRVARGQHRPADPTVQRGDRFGWLRLGVELHPPGRSRC